jgi:hypothetical protein
MPDERPPVKRRCLEGLLDKYVEMRRMRAEHVTGTAVDPKREMRALAGRFPGALREIDELPLAVIDARIDELRKLLASKRGADAPSWARWSISYHGWMRVALRVKRTPRTANLEEARERFLEDYAPAPDEPAPDELTAATFASLARPARGRLNPIVLARVAEAHGTTAAAVTRVLFPAR